MIMRRWCRRCHQETWHAREGFLGPLRPWWIILWVMLLPMSWLLDRWRCVPCEKVRKGT